MLCSFNCYDSKQQFHAMSLGASNIDKIVTKMPFVETLQYSNLYRIKEIRDEIDIIDDLV